MKQKRQYGGSLRRAVVALLAVVMLFSVCFPALRASAEDIDPTETSCTKSSDCTATEHEADCPKYVVPCTKDENCTATEHDTDCPKYVASCTRDENCTATEHEADCPNYVAPCTKDEDCTATEHDTDCPKYTAPCTETEGCTLKAGHEGDCVVPEAETVAANESTETTLSAAAQAVQALIDALPKVEELEKMDTEELNAAYEAVQAANDAYFALSEDDQATVDDSALDVLFAYFNGEIMTADDKSATITVTLSEGVTAGWVHYISTDTLDKVKSEITTVGGTSVTFDYGNSEKNYVLFFLKLEEGYLWTDTTSSGQGDRYDISKGASGIHISGYPHIADIMTYAAEQGYTIILGFYRNVNETYGNSLAVSATAVRPTVAVTAERTDNNEVVAVGTVLTFDVKVTPSTTDDCGYTEEGVTGTITINGKTVEVDADKVTKTENTDGTTTYTYPVTYTVTADDLDGITLNASASVNFSSTIELKNNTAFTSEATAKDAATVQVELYTVTYTDGVDGEEVFADQVTTVVSGADTPEFDGTPTRTGYTFTGWETADGESWQGTVTADVTYVAQWYKDSEWGKLEIEKEADTETVEPGGTVTYTITVTNSTGNNLSYVNVSDVLDTSYLTFVSFSGSGGYDDATYDETYDETTGVLEIKSLPSDESAELTITATVNDDVEDGAEILNTAKITDACDDGGNNPPAEYEYPSDTATVEVVKMVTLTIQKVWKGGSTRPNVKVQLYCDGDLYGTYTLSTGSWQVEMKVEARHEWTIKELSVPSGYKASYSRIEDDNTLTLKVTNTLKTTYTSSDTLLQTGQLNWPIPVLTVLGLALMGVGCAMIIVKKKGRYES